MGIQVMPVSILLVFLMLCGALGSLRSACLVLLVLPFALVGGILAGFAARLARGCTSGHALVGGAELSVVAGSLKKCIFAGGWMAAWFVRKQWI